MSWDEKAHEDALDRALEWLDTHVQDDQPAELTVDSQAAGKPAAGKDAQSLVDSYWETFAALPLTLDMESPPPAIRESLLRSVRAEVDQEAQAKQEVEERRDPVAESSSKAVSSAVSESAGPASPSATVTPFLRPETSQQASSRANQGAQKSSWPMALAATLTIGVLGLGFYASQLNQRLASQEKSLAELTHAVMVGHLEAETTAAARHLGDLQGRFPEVQVAKSKLFPLRGTHQTNLRGAMFVCAKHQQWYINLRGLAPAGAGQEYHLWFLTDEGPVALGPIQTQADQPYELSAKRMPPGTQGVIVSMEPLGQATGATGTPGGNIVVEGKTSIEI